MSKVVRVVSQFALSMCLIAGTSTALAVDRTIPGQGTTVIGTISGSLGMVTQLQNGSCVVTMFNRTDVVIGTSQDDFVWIAGVRKSFCERTIDPYPSNSFLAVYGLAGHDTMYNEGVSNINLLGDEGSDKLYNLGFTDGIRSDLSAWGGADTDLIYGTSGSILEGAEGIDIICVQEFRRARVVEGGPDHDALCGDAVTVLTVEEWERNCSC